MLLGQRCGHKQATMQPKVQPPEPPKPAKDYVGEAKDYNSIRARIGKGTKK